jgi:hypothetical protein
MSSVWTLHPHLWDVRSGNLWQQQKKVPRWAVTKTRCSQYTIFFCNGYLNTHVVKSADVKMITASVVASTSTNTPPVWCWDTMPHSGDRMTIYF